MPRLSIARPVMLTPALIFALFVAACNSGGERAPAGGGAANSGAAANRPGGNTAVVVNSNSAGAGNNSTAGAGAQLKAKLNLNTASSNDFLAGVPGVGNRMVHEFEEYRPYRSIQQFRREMGKYVKPEQIAEYEKYVYVPISENEADAATLQQIPGLDAGEAQQLVAARPYASRDAFLARLSEKVSAEELAVARTYLSGQ